MTAYFKFIFSVLVLLIFEFSSAVASGDHGSSPSSKSRITNIPSQENSNDRETDNTSKRIFVDGYEISVKIVDVKDSIPDGGKNNVLVKIVYENQVLHRPKVSIKINFPNGTSKTKSMLEMGDWYLAGFDLHGQGKHESELFFTDSSGTKHSITFKLL